MINYIIIDDEPVAHDIIKEYCGALSTMKLANQCYDAFEALDFLQDHTVELIFLDLNLPKLKGFDFLKTLSNPPKIIVTSAYQEFALEGYELEVVDYLLKPFSFERFLKAVNKVTDPRAALSTEQKGAKVEKSDTLFLYGDKKHVQVKVTDVLFVEAAGNYAKVVVLDKTITVREKISALLERLPSEQFIRVHKSFFVAKMHIKSIEGNRILIATHTVPIGKMYRLNVVELINR